jgi:hypothetical protein
MEKFQPAYPGWLNSGNFDFNMARNTNVIFDIFGLITSQLAVYMTLVMELYSFILLWKIYEKQRNDTIAGKTAMTMKKQTSLLDTTWENRAMVD